MNNRILKIDAWTLSDHHYLEEQDICYYAGVYTAGEGHTYSDTNQLIYNFKKTIDKRGTMQWQYKERAILQAANILQAAIKEDSHTTFVPIPPSKIKTDPLYDDRMMQLLKAACKKNRYADIRELIVQQQSIRTTHLTDLRPTPEELIVNYHIDEHLTEPIPKVICIVDDVLTTGCHFKAVQRLLKQRFPQARIAGLFLARRLLKTP